MTTNNQNNVWYAMNNFKKILIIIATLALVSCDDGVREDSLKKEFDRTERPQKITIFVYDTKSKMKQAKKNFDNYVPDVNLEGWAKWSNIESSGCEIHVMKIRSKNDTSQMEIWGHELAHCIYGAYHESGFKG